MAKLRLQRVHRRDAMTRSDAMTKNLTQPIGKTGNIAQPIAVVGGRWDFDILVDTLDGVDDG